MNQVSLSIDFFGAAGAPLVERLLNQSSNARARKTAFNNLFRLAKATNFVPREAIPYKIEFAVYKSGGQYLQFVYTLREKSS